MGGFDAVMNAIDPNYYSCFTEDYKEANTIGEITGFVVPGAGAAKAAKAAWRGWKAWREARAAAGCVRLLVRFLASQ